jgi:hypothetical protein
VDAAMTRAQSRNAAAEGSQDDASHATVRSASIPPASEPQAEGASFRVASHDILFAAKVERRCDACGARLPSDAALDPAGDDARLEGRGVYLWSRGGQVTLEHVPLCESCASAIGMTALARWEIEEEEG